ncbi:MAG: alpha/beta hydrolase [Bacillaceae bacterium]|nr:alpha/beta hydrolase [Bacillaceae bacterium]
MSRNIQNGFAEVQGTRIYYEMKGQGEPLLMIHGLNLDTRMWDDQFEVLSEQYRVIRFDLRGMGKTVMTDQPFTMYDDIKGLMGALEIEKAHVMGLSVGSYAAMEFALAYPDAVDRLIVVSPGLPGMERSEIRQNDVERFQEVLQSGDLDRIADMEVQMWYDGPGQSPDPERQAGRDRFRRMIMDAYAQPPVTNMPGKLDPSPADRLHELQMPVLVVTGDRDYPEVRELAQRIEAKAPRVKNVVMEGSAHIPPMDQPEVFNQAVLAFLQES